MNYRFKSIAAVIFQVVLLAILTSAALANDPPGWLRQAAASSVPSYEKDVPAVVLYSEHQVSITQDGTLISVENYAVKLLNRDGQNFAVARALYLVSSGKVREISGWLIRPDGTFKEY